MSFVHLLRPWDYFRKELAHMLHSRRKAEIEALANTNPNNSTRSGCSGQPLFSYLVNKISVAIDECSG
jgi:hypothetical protein